MVLLQRYYEIIDRPSVQVNKAWKGLQVFFYIVAAATGFAGSYLFGVMREEFGDNCILFPHIIFDPENTTGLMTRDIVDDNTSTVTPKPKVRIDLTKTIWGEDEICDFCQYVPIMSMIVGTIFITFFTMCPRGGSRDSQSGIKQPWHIVLPSLIITGIFAIVMLVGFLKMQNGLNAFCGEFKRELNVSSCVPIIDQFTLKWTQFDSETSVRFKSIPIVLSICVGTWFLAFITLLLRSCFVADFKIMEISLNTIDKEVSAITLEESEVLLEPEQKTATLPISQV